MNLIKVIISQLGTNWVQFPCKLIIKNLFFGDPNKKYPK